MATVKINGKEITVEDGTLILDAARQAGFEIPTFCYQARLSKQGSCRMCLVEIGGQKKLQPSCITPVIHGMEVFTETETVKSARSSMLEFLLANHPMDCPVCDKGGECELQDMVYRYGPRKGRFAEWKLRYHEKDYILSPVIVKNSNRCVKCQRCVRICSEVVGANALGSIGRGAYQEETGFLKKPLDCDQCGNCIEVCPVGSFMSLPYRYKSRPWDLKETDTVCPYCATGCQFTIGIRDGQVLRVRSKKDTGINQETLCARGRFGFGIVDSKERIKRPLIQRNGSLIETTWEEAMGVIKDRLGRAIQDGGNGIGGIASARLTNEELYLFQKVMRDVLKTNNIDSGSRFPGKVVATLVEACDLPGGGFSLYDAMKADTIFVIGSSISDENPITDYAIRLAMADRKKSLILAYPRRIKLSGSANITLKYRPGREADLVSAILAAWKGAPDLSRKVSSAGLIEEDISATARKIREASNITIFVGTDILRFDLGWEVFTNLSELARTLRDREKGVRFLPLLDRANQRGAWEMGIHPTLLPGYRQVEEGKGGMDCGEMMDAAYRDELQCLYIIAEDLVSMFPDARFVEEALKRVGFIIVQDTFLTRTARMADVVLPGVSSAEKDGTFTNQEGRVQRVRRAIRPLGEAKADWQILCDIGNALGGNIPYTSPGDIFEEIRRVVPLYKDILFDGLDGNGAMVKGHGVEKQGSGGQGVKGSSETRINPSPPYLDDYPFQLITGNHLFHSGRLSQRSDILKGLLGEPFVEISDGDALMLGVEEGELVKVEGNGYEVGLKVRIKKGSGRGVAFIPENFDEVSVNMFFKRGEGIPRVKISKQ